MAADTPGDFSLPTFRRAAQLVWPRVCRTPLLEAPHLSKLTGARVWLKCESFQVTHSFKDRAAFGTLLPRVDEARLRGVITASSGNFAQAIAHAGRALDVRVTVVMMEGSRPNKVAMTRAFGAKVVFCAPDFATREATAAQIAQELGALRVHPYDCEFTIKGTGTLGFELLEQLPNVEAVIVPVGGGGLIAAISAVLKQAGSRAEIFGVQPAVNPSFKKAFDSGALLPQPFATSIADGLLATAPGPIGFALSKQYVDGGVNVSEDEISEATILLAQEEKLVVEPSGAVGVAALYRHLQSHLRGRKVVCIASGANIDLEALVALKKAGTVPRT